MPRRVEELEKTWDFCRRIDLSPNRAGLAIGLLEPLASLLGAEAAAFRVFSAWPDVPRLTTVVGLGIPDSVHDAYLERYFKLDPARRLLTKRFTRPLFADRFGRGEWLSEHATTIGGERTAEVGLRRRYREEFRRYRDEFLLPHKLCHHLGFCFQDVSGSRTFVLNFHRPEESSPFNRLEHARAKVVSVLLQAKAAQFDPVALDERRRPRAADDDRDSLVGRACRDADAPPRGMDGCRDSLSARELEVAEAVALGLTNKEVATALSISVRTVENHMRSIFAKLRVKTRTCLAAKLHKSKSGAPATLRTASQS